ncbi:50S ribosomal protein L7ae [uncultured Megasphaera sp.]|uniref:L7Ae/L30e/S12e/Gadd45 family ribosomal protein n=1 Tax=uncultured Megasphaera sp. TaxID=165188 RepID=UPI0026240EFA|nr:50S ribosomal protein L7ae [uncultured Megasphaera sp.]
MTGQKRIGNLLGLACRARKTVCGDFAAENYLKKHAVPLLFVASDGGENAEKYRRIAARRNIAVVDIYTKEELGRTVGKSQNVVVLLTDRGFAKAIDDVIQAMKKGATR